MSDDKKAEVDIDRLSTMMRNCLIVIGILLAISGFVLSLIGLEHHAIITMLLIILLGTFFMVIKGQTFKRKPQINRGKNKTQIVIISMVFAAITFITLGSLYYGTRQPDFKIVEKRISISGLYGMTAKVDSIKLIELLPQIKLKTNGFGLGSIKKGSFYLRGFGQCTLFLNSKKAPFIYVKTSNGIPIILNTESIIETKDLSTRLVAEFEK